MGDTDKPNQTKPNKQTNNKFDRSINQSGLNWRVRLLMLIFFFGRGAISEWIREVAAEILEDKEL